ncbi:MAG: type II secretion system protein [Salinibacterium sp.]|nr:type II secretion system protein [Salinibacterium sp.]
MRASRGGFTLIEILAVILVIALLIGILSVGFAALTANANKSATQQDLIAIRNAVTQFKSDFGFLPPLVEDSSSDRVDRGSTPGSIDVYDVLDRDPTDAAIAAAFLRDENEDRFSEYSIAYYLVGALDAAIDGKEGPGYRSPRTDGTFETRGKEYGPMLDPGAGGGVEVKQRGADLAEGDVVVVDRFGTPYRYYLWLPEPSVGSLADLNVPAILGDPAENDELKTAMFAIVSAGRDKVFGTEDDFVEVGR